MPPKKQIQLQEDLETQEQWKKFIEKEGLLVTDVYSNWCGPCKAIISLFRRLKNEIGDDLLQFAIAKSDTIDDLEAYRNRSESSFLMYSANVLIAVVHGAKGPLLEKTIKEKLEHVHKVLNGEEAERVPVIDEALAIETVIPSDEEESKEEEEVKIEPIKKQVTVLVIKPDAVSAGKGDEIIEKLKEQGYEILTCEERQLTKEEAAEFYKQHETSEHFGDLTEFMSSGPCMILVVSKGETGEGVIEELREFLGPPDVEKAKEDSPESLRAQYGTDTKQNALHASDSQETAARELGFFFPNYNIPWVAGTEPPLQRTFALIRPSALQEHKDAILAKIKEAGFTIAMSKELTMTPEQAAEFYKDQQDKEFFDSLCNYMSSGPVLALCLAREDAVNKWREILGPKEVSAAKEEQPESLRAQFTTDDIEFNGLHGSSNEDEFERELQFFFPKEQTVAVIKPNAINEKDAIVKKIEESGFKVSFSKEQQITKEIASQLYFERQNSDYFNELTDFMSSGPSLFMVLTKEDAVCGWRTLMGPTDPEEAKVADPDSIRALYGENKLKNSVHGASDKESATKTIAAVFGDVEFTEDGFVKEVNNETVQENETTNN